MSIKFFEKLKNPKILLLIIFVVSFLFSNYVVLVRKNWFTFNSEAEVAIFAKNFLKTGTFKKEAIKIPGVDPKLFTPDGVGYKDSNYVPKLTYGTIVIASIGVAFGYQGIFLLFSLLGLIGAYYLYKLICLNYKENYALLGVFFFVFSFPFIFWNNFLYGNIIGFSFFIIGIYYLYDYLEYDKNKKYLIFGIFLCLVAIWIRYEFLIYFSFLILVFFVKYKRFRNIRTVLIIGIISFIFFVFPFMKLNFDTYGGPFSIGYTSQKSNASDISNNDNSISEEFISAVDNTLKRFPLVRQPAKSLGLKGGFLWILKNYSNYCLRLAPILNIWAAVCLFFLIFVKKIRQSIPSWLIVLGISSLFILYFEGSAYHWGWQYNIYHAFYSRYWIIIFAFLASVAGIAFSFKQGVFSKKVYIILIPIYLIQSFTLLFGSTSSVEKLGIAKEKRYELYNWFNQNAPESVIVTDVLSKSFVDMSVLQPMNIDNFAKYKAMFGDVVIPQNEDFIRLKEVLKKVSYAGYDIYLVEWPEHTKTYFHIAENLLTLGDDLSVERVPYDAKFNVRIYKISFNENSE